MKQSEKIKQQAIVNANNICEQMDAYIKHLKEKNVNKEFDYQSNVNAYLIYRIGELQAVNSYLLEKIINDNPKYVPIHFNEIIESIQQSIMNEKH